MIYYENKVIYYAKSKCPQWVLHRMDQMVVKMDDSGFPRGYDEDNILTESMSGHDSFLALTVGVVF